MRVAKSSEPHGAVIMDLQAFEADGRIVIDANMLVSLVEDHLHLCLRRDCVEALFRNTGRLPKALIAPFSSQKSPPTPAAPKMPNAPLTFRQPPPTPATAPPRPMETPDECDCHPGSQTHGS